MKKIMGLIILLSAATANAGIITTYTDRSAFNAVAGDTITEDFTSTAHFPIPGGVLDSATAFDSLIAGDIESGATYSTTVGDRNYFNIDAGGGFTGGFLDSVNYSAVDGTDENRLLTIAYDDPISAFGFDTNGLMPNFDLTINFSDGTNRVFDEEESFTGIETYSFFGFISDLTDIVSVVIDGYYTGDAAGSGLHFAIDNHTFSAISEDDVIVSPGEDGDVTSPGSGGSVDVPEPGSLVLLILGLAGLALARRRNS